MPDLPPERHGEFVPSDAWLPAQKVDRLQPRTESRRLVRTRAVPNGQGARCLRSDQLQERTLAHAGLSAYQYGGAPATGCVLETGPQNRQFLLPTIDRPRRLQETAHRPNKVLTTSYSFAGGLWNTCLAQKA